MCYDELQREHAVWLDRMYPAQPSWLPAGAALEEAGELLHAVMKQEQVRLWGKERRYADVDWQAKMLDAIGDVAISLCSLCNAQGWQFADLMQSPVGNVPVFSTPLAETLNLMSLCVSLTQSQRLYLAIACAAQLRIVSALLNVNVDEALQVTWQEVRLRCR